MGWKNTKTSVMPSHQVRSEISQVRSNNEAPKTKQSQILPDSPGIELCKFLAIPSDINQSKRRTIDSSSSRCQ